MEAKPKLGELLVQAGVIDDAQLKSALGEQRQWGRPLGMTLVRRGFIDEDTLIHVLASQLKLPVVKLGGKRVNPEVLDRVPVDLAEKHRCIPLLENEEGGQQVLYLGMEDPADLDALDEVSFRVGAKVKPVLVAPSQLEEALARHYHWASNAGAPGVVREDDGGGEREDEPEFLQGSSREESELNVAPPPATAVAQPRANPGGATPAAILRALSQLLVEKGVITRDELVERLRVVVREGDGDL